MIVIDTAMLLLFLSPVAAPPLDPVTQQPILFAKERMEFLVKTLEQKKTRIIIPTPALAETLVHAGAALESYMEILSKRAVFRIVSFDTKAAIELALMTRKAHDNGDKRGGINAPWAKVKFDRQIVCIAKAYNVSDIYSDDEHVKKLGESIGLTVIGLLGCPLPPDLRQADLPMSKEVNNGDETKFKLS